MPIPSPFHERTFSQCHSYKWKEWSGYYAVCSYELNHDPEYFSLRHCVGLLDVSPLFKYDIWGPEAAQFLSYIIAKNISALKVGQITYCCWCDDQGKVMDDGTVTRLDENYFRVTAAEPSFYWFKKFESFYKVEILDQTKNLGALAVQGPYSRELLNHCCDQNINDLKFFWMMKNKIGSHDVIISRTGYTGDLGYEVWVSSKDAIPVWDAIYESGKIFGLVPCGLDALDVSRVEAGFIMNGVDYFSSNKCIVDSRKSTPYELGLDWTINLDRDPFIGQNALKKEKKSGPNYKLVGLELDWDEHEKLFARYGLPPQICTKAWRDGVPIYDEDLVQIGKATSGAWSPILKKNLALASIQPKFSQPGTKIKMEVTVEYTRYPITATVSKLPFFNPPRKRA